MKVDANLHFLLYAHIDFVAVLLEKFWHPAEFLLGFGGVSEQGSNFGGAEVAWVDFDYRDFLVIARL